MQTYFSANEYVSWWPPYWPTGRLADNQKLRNLTKTLRKISNKTYSKAVIGQLKTLFRKRTNIPQFFINQCNEDLSVVGPYFTASAHASAARGTRYDCITTKLPIYGPILDFNYQLSKTVG